MSQSRARPRPRFAHFFFARRMDALPNGQVMVGLGPGAKAPQWFRNSARPR